MYGLPEDQDFKFFIGLELAEVCFGRHDIILRFENEVTATVEGDLGVKAAGASEKIVSDYREAATGLASLIGYSVARVEKSAEGTLSLHFRDGAALSFHDSSAHYESYQIQRGEIMYVI